MRIAFVVPRFGAQIVGGAEMHAGQLAARLADDGNDVEILTTCAVDHHSWRNELPAGAERSGALTVRRYAVDERDLGIHGELERAIVLGLPLSREEELLWLRHGVSSSAMEDDLIASGDRYDVIVPMPYLFGTSYFAFAARPERAVPIPCLHDEPYAHLGFVREMLTDSLGVMFNAPAEAELGRRLAGPLDRWCVVGMGFDPPGALDLDAVRRRYHLDRPFVLYVGRREGGKNTPVLIDHFRRYKHRHPGDLQLVLVGSGEPVPKDPDVRAMTIDWADRDAIYNLCRVFVQPSVNESLSIVLMQAWLARRPVVVHAHCAVTRDHCERSNGGLWFGNYAQFEEILGLLLGDPALSAALGANGEAYVRREYSWDTVLGRFRDSARRWTASVGTA